MIKWTLLLALAPSVAFADPAATAECNQTEERCESVCLNAEQSGATDATVGASCLASCEERADSCRAAADAQ